MGRDETVPRGLENPRRAVTRPPVRRLPLGARVPRKGAALLPIRPAADLHAKLVEAGLEVEKKRVHLTPPVKTLGKHTANIKLHADVNVELTFDVVSENPIIPAAE